ncbi:MAG: hypothetical protein R3195_01545 [Gemmatimonadota bacterium]|nr:hypothetical protein [Gemmatimonadota bacterium]
MGDDDRRKWGHVMARAWTDPAYKHHLFYDPRTVLTEAGLHVPKNVHVHESGGDTLHFVLGPRPEGLSDEDL